VIMVCKMNIHLRTLFGVKVLDWIWCTPYLDILCLLQCNWFSPYLLVPLIK